LQDCPYQGRAIHGQGEGKGYTKKLKQQGKGMQWAIQGSKLTKMKGNSQHKPLFNTAKLYSHLLVDKANK